MRGWNPPPKTIKLPSVSSLLFGTKVWSVTDNVPEVRIFFKKYILDGNDFKQISKISRKFLL